jgi:hypothetical protein
LKQVNIYLIQRHLPKGAAGPLACSVHDPAGSLVVVNTTTIETPTVKKPRSSDRGFF